MNIILPSISTTTQVYGSFTTVENKTLFPSSSILDYLPKWEGQSHTYFDDYSCVARSFENAVQVLTNKQFYDLEIKAREVLNKYKKDNEVNFSDRDLSVLSGTVPRVGNSGQKVLDTARAKGLVPEDDYDRTSRDTQYTEKWFFSYVRSEANEKIAQEWLKVLDLEGEWVHRDDWGRASKEGVLQIYVNAWHLKNSKYYNPTGRYNHAVILADYKDKKILDTYQPEIKELSSWNDAHEWALKINLNEKTMEKIKLENNTLVQEVEQSGQFGLYLDGKILVGDEGKVALSFYMRNNGDTRGKTRALKREHWEQFDKYDLAVKNIIEKAKL